MARTEKTNDQAPLKKDTPPPTKKTYKPKEMTRNRRIITLAIGDAIAFLIFASFGLKSHNEGLSIPQIIITALPFAAGWFLVSPFVGAFRSDIVANPRAMTNRTALAWLLSWPVAMALRWLLVERTQNTSPNAFITFAIVVFVFNLAILLLWRWPFALNNSLRQREM